ncbi:MAG: molybdenum cofactor guanylyltransferase [Candidatus Caldarchaeum sp.]
MKACGLILAGGVSKRFGGDKAFAIVDGEPMVKHAARTLYQAFGEAYLSVNTAERGGMLFNAARPYVSGFIVDVFDAGPLSGLLTAAHKVEAEVFVTAPTDTPYLKPSSLSSLLQQHLESDADAASVVWGNGAVETLIQAVKRTCLLNYAEKFLNFRRSFLRPSDILRSAEKLLLVHASNLTDNPLEFSNINTVEDLSNPKPRGPLQGHVKNNLLITGCSKHFSDAAEKYGSGSYYSAGLGYMEEAATYLKHGVTHLSSHAFFDAAKTFQKAGNAEASNLMEHLALLAKQWMNIKEDHAEG